jgi:hypothetical protein
MTHEQPIMLRDENCFFQRVGCSNRNRPKPVGQINNIDIHTGAGLPMHIKGVEAAAVLGVIKSNTTIVWNPTIQACKSLAVTFADRQRVMPYFHSKPGNDNVKVAVEYDTGDKIHFAKCVLCLRESLEEYFVLLQWYDEVGRQPLDSVSGLVQLVLRPPNVTRSYSIMPINSIVNGAIITRSEDRLWVLLSQRETFTYELTNTSNCCIKPMVVKMKLFNDHIHCSLDFGVNRVVKNGVKKQIKTNEDK